MLIEARDMLSKPQRSLKYQQTVEGEYQIWLEAQEDERLEAERLEAEARREENGEKITHWKGLSFEQRENRRRSDQNITDQIALQELPDNLREQLEDIENNDSLVRNRLARTELNRRMNMSYEERSRL